jgi:hypothetical protein
MITEIQKNRIIAKIILSTKRKNRPFSLFEIATDIKVLKNEFGGMNEVSKVVGVSAGMLNKFLSVFKLPIPVIELVRDRKVDSVSNVHYLSKFNENDALQLVDLLSSNKLSSHDLRALIPYRKQHANVPIIDLVEKIHLTKNIKVYVIKINKEDTTKSINELNSLFAGEVGKENIIKIESNNIFVDIKLSIEGAKILRQKAKTNNKTFQKFITALIK